MNNQDYYDTLPKKRMAVGVIFLNEAQEILIVKPTYRDAWSVPGGVVEEEESLRAACIREVGEELGISVTNMKLLGLDYMSPETTEYPNKSENIQFIFYGGILSENDIRDIKIPEEELSGFAFRKQEDAVALLGKNLSKRILSCLDALKNGTAIYLENGEAIL